MGVGMVSGSQTVLRLRWLREYIKNSESQGIQVEWVDAGNPGELEQSLAGNPFMDEAKRLLVVSNPDKGDLDVYRSHDDPEVQLLLHYEGDPRGSTKFGKYAKSLGKAHGQFSCPNKWQAEDAAVEFAVKEAGRQGKSLDKNLATALVRLVGSDFGVLVFEVLKMSILAEARGKSSIGKEEIRDGRAELIEASVSPIIDSLRLRRKSSLIKAMDRLMSSSKDDPTLRLCRILGSEAMKWLQAASLDALPPKQAAQELGINPWYFENKILPVAKSWGKDRILKLVHALAQAERAVLQGDISPWVGLKCRLLDAC